MRKVKKDDMVLVLSGNNKGAKGRVLKVFTENDRVLVEGINIRKKHTRPSQQMPQGGIVEIEAPIHVSNVKVIAPKSNVPSRIGIKVLKDGSKVRYCKHPDANGEEIIS